MVCCAVAAHVTAVVGVDGAAARDLARPVVTQFGRNEQYAAMFAAAGMPILDGVVSDELVDALIVSGDGTTLTDRLGERADGPDELVVSLESAGGRREDEITLFGVLGNLARAFAR